MATSPATSLRCPASRPETFTVALYTTRPITVRSPCTTVAPRLHLSCASQRCDGVYPVRFTITSKGATTSTWSLLALQASQVSKPIKVDFIATLAPSAWNHRIRSIATLEALHDFPLARVTLGADYRTLNIIQATTPEAMAFRAALDLALLSHLHDAVSAPPGNIDFGGLAANGLSSQVAQQISLSGALLKSITGRSVEGPVLLSGSPSLTSITALAGAKVADVILPEGDLSVAPSTTLNWGAPFHIQGAAAITAISTDSALSALVTDSSIEPGRRAALVLGTLAFLHFEAPNAPTSRSVVIEAPIASTPAAFITDFLRGFSHNPFVSLSSLTPTFTSTLIGTNGAPTTLSLAPSSSTSQWSSHNVSSLTTLIAQVGSYSQAVTSSYVSNELRVAVEKSEVVGEPDKRQRRIDAATNGLNKQLSSFSVDPSAITLAGPGTSLPITLISRANYTVTAVVHLITDRLEFPKGKDVIITLDSPTKSLRVPTSSHQGSSLTLQVVVTTPDDQVTLARAAIQVRIAGTSIVGYLLSLASLLVLATWWWRTYRRRSKGRHAR